MLLFIPIIFIIYPLAIPGIPITLDFPSMDTSDYASGKLWVWTEKGSLPALETITRFPIISLWFALGYIGLNSALVSKFLIVLGFLIASFSFYFSFFFFFKNKIATKYFDGNTKLKIAALIGALFFAYNPWSFERIPHWYLWIGYAILPLFFISIIYAFRNPTKLKYIATSIFLWSFASTTPHMTVFYGLIFATVFVAFILNNIFFKTRDKKVIDNNIQYKNKEISKILLLLIPFVSVILLYSLVNAYWIYPVLLSSEVRSISPNYLMVEETLEFLSREADFLNTFRLVINWQEQPFEIPVQGTAFNYVWYLASLALPIFGFAALVISRKFMKYTSVFAIFAVIGIILAMGTQSPINYFKYVLENPSVSDYGWLVRDPDKWGFLIAFTYSFLIGISSFKILELIEARIARLRADKPDQRGIVHARQNKRKEYSVAAFFISLIIASTLVYSYPVYVFNMLGELRPVVLPTEFDKLNNYLSDVDAHNVYFIPYPLDETKWNKMNRVGNIYQTHSIKPSIESSGSTGMAGMESTNYYNYLANSVVNNRSKDIRNFIYPLGTSYLIFHNDTWDKRINTPDKNNLKLLEGIESLKGLENVRNIGFFNIFRVNGDNNNSGNATKDPEQVSILDNNIVALGGLDTLQSLNSLQPYFSSLNSSLFFIDEGTDIDGLEDILSNSDSVILGNSPSYDDLIFSLLSSRYIIEPSKASVDYDPMRLWSKTGTMDPDNGVFHPYLKLRGINNWQFDYGKGLVITQSVGANLTIPLDISKNGSYDLFLRYLKNQEGGIINVYLDNRLLNQLSSLDESSNNFVWQRVTEDDSSPLNLKQGKHMLTIENVAGFNAINMLGLVPSGLIDHLRDQVTSLVNKSDNAHILEAESSFYNDKGGMIRGNDSLSLPSPSNYYLFGTEKADGTNKTNHLIEADEDYGDLKGGGTVSGQFRLPENADLLKFEFLSGSQNFYHNRSNIIPFNLVKNQSGSDYYVENLRIYPAVERQGIVASDFERSNDPIPLAELRGDQWVNHNGKTLSLSLDTKNAISGNASLRVDVAEGNQSEWSMITTDHLPINDKSYYNFTLAVSAKDVNQLYGRVTYYDKDGEKMGSEPISKKRDGTFNDLYSASIVPPSGAKYLRFEILIKPVTVEDTSYLIDDIRFEEIQPPVISFDRRLNDLEKMETNLNTNNSSSFSIGLESISNVVSNNGKSKTNNFINESYSLPNQTVQDKINYSMLDEKPRVTYSNEKDGNTVQGIIQQTKPIPVRENGVYNFSISIKEKGTSSTGESTKLNNASMGGNPVPAGTIVAHFTSSNDVTANSTKYGHNASGGRVLTLGPDSQIYSDLDILKPANYTIALRTNICKDCSYLNVTIKDKDNDKIISSIPLSSENQENSRDNRTYPLSLESNNSFDGTITAVDKNNLSQLKWMYLNNSVYLSEGKYQVGIHSNSNSTVDLDAVAIFSSKNDIPSTEPSVQEKVPQPLEKIFESSESPPAYLEEYRKINPTLYEVKIKNATRPYIMSLVETFDPLWKASYKIGTESEKVDEVKDNGIIEGIKDLKIPNIPLYSIINGFYINKTGDYTLKIEYQPQTWFTQGALVSIIAAIVIVTLLAVPYFRTLIRNLKTRRSQS